MALTDFGQLSDARKKVWAAKITQAGRDKSFFMSNGMVGSGTSDMNKPIHRITELTESERGTEAVMQLVQDLEGDGIAGDAMLEGNEESLVNDVQTIRIDQLRHGVKSMGAMSRQETVIRFRAQAKDKLSFWLADSTDELMFLTASGRGYTLNTDGTTRTDTTWSGLKFSSDVSAASTNRIVYGGSATSEGSITATDTMTWDLIIETRTKAERERIKPIRSGGRDWYMLVMSSEQCRDLRQTSDWKEILSRGHTRGDSNPLFRGADVAVDGVIIYHHNKVFNTLGLGASSKWGAGGAIDGAQALFMGSQALGWATIGEPKYNESDNTDYGNRQGLKYGRIFGLLKPQYKSRYNSFTREDFGIISLKTAAAA